MLSLKMNEHTIEIEFWDLYTSKMKHSESFSHDHARRIAEDILSYLDQLEQSKAALHA